MSQRTIRFGIIGCGLMGREFASAAARWPHLLNVSAKPEIVAVCDPVPSQFEWFTQNFAQVDQTTSDYRELLSNPSVEAVYCAVPHNLQEQIFINVIESGKHLFGEKPFGIDVAANSAILSAAAQRPDLVVRCSSEFPFFPAVQRIMQFIEEGRFGTILEVECGFEHSSDMDTNKPINWKRIAACNGEYGCMGDLGMHVLHIPLRAGWMPRNVRAILSNVVPQRKDASGNLVDCDTFDNAILLCEVENKGQAFPLTARFMRMAPGETNNWHICIKGTRFSARFSTKRPRTLETMPYENGASQEWRSEDLGYASVYKTITGGIFEFGFCDAILQMIAAFCDQIARGPEAALPFGCATFEETQHCHMVLSAALKSHRMKQVVEVAV